MSPKRLAGHAVTVEVVDVTSDHAEVAGCDVRAVEGVVHDGDAGAGLVAVVGVVICEGILDIEMVRSQYLLDVSNTFAFNYALIASLAAIVAMGLAHLLVFTTPRPRPSTPGSSASPRQLRPRCRLLRTPGPMRRSRRRWSIS